jgi:hypothetical protein
VGSYVDDPGEEHGHWIYACGAWAARSHGRGDRWRDGAPVRQPVWRHRKVIDVGLGLSPVGATQTSVVDRGDVLTDECIGPSQRLPRVRLPRAEPASAWLAARCWRR